MTYVLDTNAVSALMKGKPAVVHRLASMDRASIGVPQAMLAEIAYGIERQPPAAAWTRQHVELEDGRIA